MLFNLHILVNFPVLLQLISSFIPLWLEMMLDMISILNLLRFVLWPNIKSILRNGPRVREKNVFSAAIRWNVL